MASFAGRARFHHLLRSQLTLDVDVAFGGTRSTRVVDGGALGTAAFDVDVRQAQAGGGYTFFSVDTGSLNLPGLYTGKAGVALALVEAGDGLQMLPAVLSSGLLDDSSAGPG